MLKQTDFYDRFLRKSFKTICKLVVGPRIKMFPLPIVKNGFSNISGSAERKYFVLRVAIVNKADVTFGDYLTSKSKFFLELNKLVNLFVPCVKLENGHISTRFFNSQWELIPEPKQKRPFGLPSGSWLSLSRNAKATMDVAGILCSGKSYGVTSDIKGRWLITNDGDPNIDIPLDKGDYYVEISIKDYETSVAYAISYFLLKNAGSVETFELFPIKRPHRGIGILKDKKSDF